MKILNCELYPHERNVAKPPNHSNPYCGVYKLYALHLNHNDLLQFLFYLQLYTYKTVSNPSWNRTENLTWLFKRTRSIPFGSASVIKPSWIHSFLFFHSRQTPLEVSTNVGGVILDNLSFFRFFFTNQIGSSGYNSDSRKITIYNTKFLRRFFLVEPPGLSLYPEK